MGMTLLLFVNWSVLLSSFIQNSTSNICRKQQRR